jgi:brefeldin A-inhibited guanine nucleotide-exchange protein
LIKFGEKYFKDNPTTFSSATTAYTLSYALMMLQTSLHNKQVKPKDRIKLTDFEKIVRGLDDGKDLKSELIKQMYAKMEI